MIPHKHGMIIPRVVRTRAFSPPIILYNMNYTNRKEAARYGAMFYTTERPCHAGHIGKRYTSTGQCVDCTKQAADDLRTVRRNLKVEKNKLLAAKMVEHTIWVEDGQRDFYDAIAKIMRHPAAADLTAYVALLSASELTHDMLLTKVAVNPDGTLRKLCEIPERRDSRGEFQIELFRFWYAMGDVKALAHGEVDTIDRINTPFLPFLGE